MAVGFIDPKAVILTFGGVIISGFVEDDHIEVERQEVSFKDKPGLDGQVIRTKTGDRRGSVKLKLQQTSLSNDYLTGLLALDENTLGVPAGVRPLLIEDLNTQSAYFASQAWIEKHAKAGFGSTGKDREWTIKCAELVLVTLGNAI